MLIAAVFWALAAIHLLPAAAAAAPAQLSRLYGTEPEDTLLGTLLQHRALLLGLVGSAFAAAAFMPELRWPALIGGTVSMAGFLVIAALRGELTGRLRLIVAFDVVGVVLAGLLVFLMMR